MSAAAFSVGDDQLRDELAGDLARAGYVFRAGQRFFDKHLVLCRPGLLARAADLLTRLVPGETERIAVNGPGCALVGALVSQRLGIPLLLGDVRDDGRPAIQGERHSGMRVLLLEDVVHTGARALAGVEALRALDAEVANALCMLDRECGGAQRLAGSGVALRALYTERELLRTDAAGR